MLFNKNTKLSRLHNNANIITLGSRLIKKILLLNVLIFLLILNLKVADIKKGLKKFKKMSSETKYLNSNYEDFFEKVFPSLIQTCSKLLMMN